MRLRYYKGDQKSREFIEYEIYRRGQYYTTCVINVPLLLAGVSIFPCGNGDDVKLTPKGLVEILTFLQEERKKITDKYPVKTFKGWQESGLPTLDDYCFPGDKVDVEFVDYFANILPPETFTAGYLQVGSAISEEQDDDKSWRSTYITFTVVNGETDDAGHALWLYRGCCFTGQTDNRINRKSRIEELISAARKEAEA